VGVCVLLCGSARRKEIGCKIPKPADLSSFSPRRGLRGLSRARGEGGDSDERGGGQPAKGGFLDGAKRRGEALWKEGYVRPLPSVPLLPWRLPAFPFYPFLSRLWFRESRFLSRARWRWNTLWWVISLKRGSAFVGILLWRFLPVRKTPSAWRVETKRGVVWANGEQRNTPLSLFYVPSFPIG